MFSPSSKGAVRLAGGLPGTTTFLYYDPDGSLIIEFYDHSAEAERSFGNDVAFRIHVDAERKARILTLLGGSAQFASASDNDADDDQFLFERLRERFGDYYELRRWLDANDIPYRKTFVGQA